MKLLSLLAAAFMLGGQARAASTDKIVTFDSSMSPAQRIAAVESLGGRVVMELPLINAVVVKQAEQDLSTIVAELDNLPAVMQVKDDDEIQWLDHSMISRPLAPPVMNTTISASKPEIPWGIWRVDAPAAWSVTRGQGVKVAVIDTGIDMKHQDLIPNIAGGWNEFTQTADFQDDNGHGTHVAGTIAAAGVNGGVIGVAPQASLYGVKSIQADGTASLSYIIAGLDWAVANHMNIANMSLSTDRDEPLFRQSVEAAIQAGVTVVAAAGNDGGQILYPGAYPGVITVAASDNQDNLYDFSSNGTQLTLIAPGVDIKSTYLGGGYETMSGTSMATAHVSGLAALAVALGFTNPADVRAALTNAANKLSGLFGTQQGAGLVDAGKLVREKPATRSPAQASGTQFKAPEVKTLFSMDKPW